MQQTGIVNIRGREYKTVALRVQEFREQHQDFSLTSEIVSIDQEVVVVRASIADPTGRVLATGHAEERRAASQINKTSALENAETSAFGRALAAFGFGGSEFASADEVANAIHQQHHKPEPVRFEHEDKVRTLLVNREDTDEYRTKLKYELSKIEKARKAPFFMALTDEQRAFVREVVQ